MAGTPILGHEMYAHQTGSEMNAQIERDELGTHELHEMPAREPVGSEMPNSLGGPRITEDGLIFGAGHPSVSTGVSVLSEESRGGRGANRK